MTALPAQPDRVIERSQVVPVEIDEAFAFFADAWNLEGITPPWLGSGSSRLHPHLREDRCSSIGYGSSVCRSVGEPRSSSGDLRSGSRTRSSRPVPSLGAHPPAHPGRRRNGDLRPRPLPTALRAARRCPRAGDGPPVAEGDLRLSRATDRGSSAVRASILTLHVRSRPAARQPVPAGASEGQVVDALPPGDTIWTLPVEQSRSSSAPGRSKSRIGVPGAFAVRRAAEAYARVSASRKARGVKTGSSRASASRCWSPETRTARSAWASASR